MCRLSVDESTESKNNVWMLNSVKQRLFRSGVSLTVTLLIVNVNGTHTQKISWMDKISNEEVQQIIK